MSTNRQPPERPPRRPYRSERRAQAAAGTRSAILGAALRLFIERGYARVTVQDIAAEASTAVPTVYASTGGKAAILDAIIGDAMRDPIVEQTLTALDECDTAPQVLELLTHGVRIDSERYRDVISVMHDAAASDETAAKLLAQSNASFRTDLSHAAARLQKLDALKPGLTREQALDVLWFYLGHQAWKLLISDQGWSFDEAERWLARQLTAALLTE